MSKSDRKIVKITCVLMGRNGRTRASSREEMRSRVVMVWSEGGRGESTSMGECEGETSGEEGGWGR
jgi:hypothetical protein